MQQCAESRLRGSGPVADDGRIGASVALLLVRVVAFRPEDRLRKAPGWKAQSWDRVRGLLMRLHPRHARASSRARRIRMLRLQVAAKSGRVLNRHPTDTAGLGIVLPALGPAHTLPPLSGISTLNPQTHPVTSRHQLRPSSGQQRCRPHQETHSGVPRFGLDVRPGRPCTCSAEAGPS